MEKHQTECSEWLDTLYPLAENNWIGIEDHTLSAYRRKIEDFQDGISCLDKSGECDDVPEDLIGLHLNCQVAMDSIDEALAERK